MLLIGTILTIKFYKEKKMKKDDEIRLIAYSIWEQEGCLDGRDCAHWFRAEAIWEQRQKPTAKVKTQDIGARQYANPITKTKTTKKK
jgi:hypothetical protein